MASAMSSVNAMPATGPRSLPSYAPALAAFHRACARPLRRIVDALPIAPGARVLDTPCGDGTYLSWLAERVGPEGHVFGVDRSRAYLDAARHGVASSSGLASRVHLIVGEMQRLPFADESFDFVWCAHSLYSLSDPATVLAELKRVVRRGGSLGVLENDSFHHWLLPWPVELELAVRRAQLVRLEGQTRTWRKHYAGRGLSTLLAEAELADIEVVTHTIDHAAPLDVDERALILDYLAGLRELTAPVLDGDTRAGLDAFIDGRGGEPAAIDRDDFFAAQLEIVATARRT
jgi:SAM-dependent methyltransferase